jgi:hypothetical protein
MTLIQEIFNDMDKAWFGQTLQLYPNAFRFMYSNDINYIHQHTDRAFISSFVSAMLSAGYIRDIDFALILLPSVYFYAVILRSYSVSLDLFYYDFYHNYYGD